MFPLIAIELFFISSVLLGSASRKMFPGFEGEFSKFPLITSSSNLIRDRYFRFRTDSSFFIRFILSAIEQIFFFTRANFVKPTIKHFSPYREQRVVRFLLNNLDNFLCAHIETIRYFCPFLNENLDQLMNRWNEKLVGIRKQNMTQQKRIRWISIECFLRYLTDLLSIIEINSKNIVREFNAHIEISRSLWKTLNLADGRTLDEVEAYSEKLLVLGRRFIGNSRQLAYLIRYQLKRCRSMASSMLNFCSKLCRLTRLIPFSQSLNELARERIRHYLDILMFYAMNHPWISPITRRFSRKKSSKPWKPIRPMFFLPMSQGSDVSEAEDRIHRCRYQSTPNGKLQYKSFHSNSRAASDECSSTISSSSSSETLSESFNVKEVIRQISSVSRQTSETIDSVDQEAENRMIEQALNETDDQTLTSHPGVSVFDLSPMLASGCAV